MTNFPRKRKKSQLQSPDREYYPAFLDIAGKKCVVIGGGKVAERKCSALLRAGAQVIVISPELTPGLEDYKNKGKIRHVNRRYRSGDIKSAFIAVSATENEETNKKVASDAAGRGILLNVVDRPALCGFIVPAILRRGNLTIAVSTGGVSPAMAATIRRHLEGIFGTEISRYLKFLKDTRMKTGRRIGDKSKRERFLKELASERMLEMLLTKGFRKAKEEALSYKESYVA